MGFGRSSLILLAFISAVGCGGKKGGKKDGKKSPQNPNDPDTPATVEEAVARLGDEERKTLDAWKKSLVKTCSLGEALPKLMEPREGDPDLSDNRGIDLELFTAKVGDPTLIAAEGDASFAILADPEFPSATFVSQRETTRRITINGKTRESRFKGSFIETDGECVVNLFDKEVYRTKIARTIPVITHYEASADRPMQAGSMEIKENRLVGSPQYVELGIEALVAPLSILKESKGGDIFMTEHLGLTEAEKSLFPTTARTTWDQSDTTLYVSVKPRDISELTLYVDPFDPLPVPYKRNQVEELISQLPETIEFDVSLSRTDQTEKAYSLTATVQTEQTPELREAGKIKARLLKLSKPNLNRPKSDQIAQCFDARVQAFGKLDYEISRRVFGADLHRPTPNQLVSGCGGLGDLGPLLYKGIVQNENFKGRLLDIFAPLETGIKLGHWQIFLKKYVAAGLEEDQSIADIYMKDTAVSGENEPFRKGLIEFSEGLESELKDHPNLQELRLSLHEFSIDRSAQQLRGLAYYDKTPAELLQTLESLIQFLSPANGNAYLDSAAIMSPELDFVEVCAAMLNDKTKESYQRSQAMAVTLEQQDWLDEETQSWLRSENCSTRAFGVWEQSLQDAKEFWAAEKERLGSDGYQPYYESRYIDEVVEHGLTEGWNKANYNDHLPVFASLYEAFATCDHRVTNSSQLTCAAGHDWKKVVSLARGGMLHPDVVELYMDLGRKIASYVAILDDVSRHQNTYKMAREFYAPIWKSCSTEAFQEKSNELNDLVEQVKAGSDGYSWYTNFNDVLEDCE